MNDGAAAAAGGSLHHALARYIPFTASLAAKGGNKIRTSSYPCLGQYVLIELVRLILVRLELVQFKLIHGELVQMKQIHCKQLTFFECF